MCKANVRMRLVAVLSFLCLSGRARGCLYSNPFDPVEPYPPTQDFVIDVDTTALPSQPLDLDSADDFFLSESSGFCSNPMPGVRRQVSGVDITRVDLFLDSHTPGDDGFMGPVVGVTCFKGNKITIDGVEYDQPDQVWRITPRNTAKLNLDTKVFTSTKDVKTDLAARAEVKGDGWLGSFSFSASASYKQMEHTLTNGSNFISQVSASVQSVDVDLLPPTSDILGEVALQMIESFSEDYFTDPQPYKNFISQFGTHFFQNGRFGGIIRSVQTTSESYLETHTEREIHAQASANFGEWMKMHGGVDDSKVDIDTNYAKSTSNEYGFFGGKTNLFNGQDALKEWPPSVDANPWMLGGQLVAISDAVKDQSKKKQLIIAVEQHVLRRYLEQLLRQLDILRATRFTAVLNQLYLRVYNMLKHNKLDRGAVQSLGNSIEVYNDSGFKCGDARADNYKFQVFQRRDRGTVDFFKSWKDYKFGFGDGEGDFWLGLEAVHNCCPIRTSNYDPSCTLKVSVNNAYVLYWFALGNETSGYELHASPAGNFPAFHIGDGLSYQNLTSFSTYDRHNSQCAREAHSAWWYPENDHHHPKCHGTDLNSVWRGDHRSERVAWLPTRERGGFPLYDIYHTEMSFLRYVPRHG